MDGPSAVICVDPFSLSRPTSIAAEPASLKPPELPRPVPLAGLIGTTTDPEQPPADRLDAAWTGSAGRGKLLPPQRPPEPRQDAQPPPSSIVLEDRLRRPSRLLGLPAGLFRGSLGCGDLRL
jgi:hypothetical protein